MPLEIELSIEKIFSTRRFKNTVWLNPDLEKNITYIDIFREQLIASNDKKELKLRTQKHIEVAAKAIQNADKYSVDFWYFRVLD